MTTECPEGPLECLVGRLRGTYTGSPLEVASKLDDLCSEAADAIELLQARLDIAMTTLRQIEATPRNKGARRNALATVRFLDTQPPNAELSGAADSATREPVATPASD